MYDCVIYFIHFVQIGDNNVTHSVKTVLTLLPDATG